MKLFLNALREYVGWPPRRLLDPRRRNFFPAADKEPFPAKAPKLPEAARTPHGTRNTEHAP